MDVIYPAIFLRKTPQAPNLHDEFDNLARGLKIAFTTTVIFMIIMTIASVCAVVLEVVPIKLHVNTFESTSMSISNRTMSANFRVNLSVTTTVDEDLYFNPLKIWVKYGDKVLTSVNLEPFHVSKSSQKTFPTLEMGIRVDDHVTVYSMNKDLIRNGALEFILTAKAHMFVPQDYPDISYDKIVITCKGIRLGFLSGYDSINHTMLAQPPHCKSRFIRI